MLRAMLLAVPLAVCFGCGDDDVEEYGGLWLVVKRSGKPVPGSS